MGEEFGSKEWCLWCKSKDMDNYKELQFVQKKGTPGETVWVCSDECERAVNDAMVLVQKGLPIFIGGLFAMLALGGLGMVLGFTVHPQLLHIASLGLLVFGVILMKYPMVTPQTIELMGLKKGFTAGRIGGVVMVALGIAVSVLSFLYPPP